MEISDYGVIGNCRTAALVSKRGSIDWCCLPQFDSPSYFAGILDSSAGHFSIRPIERFSSQQRYVPDSNVLQTRFQTESGQVEITDAFTLLDSEVVSTLLSPDIEILRVIEAIHGEVTLLLEFSPVSQYGQQGLQLQWLGKLGLAFSQGKKLLLLRTSLPHESIRLETSSRGHSFAQARFRLKAGERVIVSLSYAEHAPAVIPELGQAAMERLAQTIHTWRLWLRRGHFPEFNREIVKRSALALKLLNFAPSGAFIAAVSSSLPEWIGGERNWDYRYCWLRDASFTVRALLDLGYTEEARSYVNWLLHSTRLTWPRLQVMYSVYGESRIQEETASWLRGFKGSSPVRFGNGAVDQIQLDVYGEVIDAVFRLAPQLESLDRETRKMILGFGDTVHRCWDQPDHGIWEVRQSPRHYTHSKLMAWVAMDRIARLAERYNWSLSYDPIETAIQIRSSIERYGYDHEVGSYVQAFGSKDLDASLLVMPLVGYCDARDARFARTRRAILSRLSKNGLIYRYRPGSDGIRDPEGTFGICNFWLIQGLAMAGKISAARQNFEVMIGKLSPTGLYAEEFDPDGEGQLGNYPQGFSHIGMVRASFEMEEAIEQSETQARRRAS